MKNRKSIDSYQSQMTVRDKLFNIRTNAKLISLNKPKYAKHKSTFEMYKSVWNRINELKIKCKSNARISSLEISRYRHSQFQSILTDLLIKGFHRSFSFIFNINQKREDLRKLEGPDSTRWKMTSLADSPNLRQICQYLSNVEMAQRTNDSSIFMNNINALIKLFSVNPEDNWINDELVGMELKFVESTDLTVDKDRYLQAIGNLTAGINSYKNGQLEKSSEYLSKAYSLCHLTKWIYLDDMLMIETCAEYLCSVYMELACTFVSNQRIKMIYYLKQAHEIGKELKIKEVEMNCCYKLGVIFENMSQLDVAIGYFRGLEDISEKVKNSLQCGIACEMLAKCFKKQSNQKEMFRYLNKFVEIAEFGCNWEEYVRANCLLGNAYSQIGDDEKAKSVYYVAFFTAWCLKIPKIVLESLMLYRSSEANIQMLSYETIIKNNEHSAHEYLVYLKDHFYGIDLSVLNLAKFDEKNDTFDIRNRNLRSKS